MAKKILVFGLIFALTLGLYFPVFKIFFTGDDFFHFKVSLTYGSLASFIKLFGFYPFDSRGIAFYRPLFREVTYNLVYQIWGLNQIPLRVLSMLLHFSNVVLVFIFIKQIFKSERVAYLTSLFFSIAVANTGAIYYLAGGLQAQGATLFVLSTLIIFPKHKILAFITFILSLMSHELAVVTPALLVGLMILNKDFKVKYVWPYLALVIVYLYADFKIIGFSKSEIQYRLSLNPKSSINNIFWYGLWSFGLPETLIDFIGPGFKLNPNLFKYWGYLYKFISPAFFASIATLLAIFMSKIIKLKRIILKKEIIFLGFWFVTGISTVVFLPLHKSTYYLALSLPAFWAIVSYFLFEKSKVSKFLSLVFVICLSVLIFYSTRAMDITYWASQRGKLSERLISDIKTKYPSLPKGASIVVKNDPNYPFIADDWGGTSKQANLILSGSDALQLLYNDPSLKVFYEDLGIPKDEVQDNSFEFMAKIN